MEAAATVPWRKALGLVDLVLFTASAIIVADTVAASAAIGVQAMGWWVLSIVLFFLPYGLVTAELGSAWPQEGGIYVWVREAYGPFWGTLTSWLYWINVAYWMPSVYVLFAGVLASVFWPLSNAGQAIVTVVLVWITVALGIMDIRVAKWIPNLGAIIKVLLLLLLGGMGAWYAVTRGAANSFTPAEWVPRWSATLSFLPVIVYNYMGFELMSAAGEEMHNPRRDVPLAILLAGIVIAGVYMLATFGVLAAIPLEQINIVTGITDALKAMTEGVPALGGLFYLAAALLLATFLANMVTWSLGANRVIAATGLDRQVPSILGHIHPRYGSPDYAYIMMGMVATILAVGNYLTFTTAASVFWTIFALSSVVFLLPYLLMFPAFLSLRLRRPDQPRPFTVPGGAAGAWLSTILGEFFILIAIVFFFMPPEETTNVWAYEIQLIGGTLLTILVGVIIYAQGRRRAGG
ncbi:MAG: amino acid permease [Bacillota bacterium]|nr:amino acid permease [Bacillota bacterium]